MKTYNNEKAIISLTTWKARVGNTHKTLENLLSLTQGAFHIVLVLSEEEFPNKERDLPTTITSLANENLIEILWTEGNYKSLKKVLFTMEKYPNVPIISADDDLIYFINYAEALYQYWQFNKKSAVSFNINPGHTCGACTLYGPGCFGTDYMKRMKENKNVDVYAIADDAFYEYLYAVNMTNLVIIPMPRGIFCVHDEIEKLHDLYSNQMSKIRDIQRADINDDALFVRFCLHENEELK